MSLRVRDKQAKINRVAIEAADKAKQDAAAKESRNKRKAELRAQLERRARYAENTSHLPAKYKTSKAPEIELRAGDEEILAELNEDYLRELNPVEPEPAQVQFIDDGGATLVEGATRPVVVQEFQPKPKTTAEVEAIKKAEQAQANAKAAAAQFLKEEKLYYPSPRNFELPKNYVLDHMSESDRSTEAFLDAFRQAFSALYGKLEQRPQASQEDRTNDYFEKVVHHTEGKDWTEAELDKLSADDYARVMCVLKRAPLGSIMRSPSRR